MTSRIISTLGIIALYFTYSLVDWPNKEILLVAAIILAIDNAADRISNKP